MFFFKKKHPHHITVLPNPALCPEGEIVPAEPGKSVAEILLQNKVEIDHSCQLQCSCTTCHVHIMEGAAFLSAMDGEEDRVLQNAAGRDRFSRLACQAVFNGGGNVVVEIP